MIKERMYSFYDIAALEGMSVQGVRTRFFKANADKSKIKTLIVYDSHGAGHTEMLFTASQLVEFKLIGRSKKSKQPKVCVQKKVDIAENIEELRRQHNLVKDDRFFTLSYFPDVIPVCFLTEEEEEVI